MEFFLWAGKQKSKKLKGQHPLVSYVFAILLGVIMVAAITLLLILFQSQIAEAEIKRELTQLTAMTANEISKIYLLSRTSHAAPGNYTSVEISKSKLELPPKVGGKSYEIALTGGNLIAVVVSSVKIGDENATFSIAHGAKVVGKTRDSPIVEIETELPNIDIELQGKIINGQNSTLRYIRHNVNGTLRDVIVAGGDDILVQISNVEVN